MSVSSRPRVLAAAALAGVLVVGLSSCAGKPRDPDPESKAATPDIAMAAPAATKDVETLTWNLPGGEPTTLDPVKIFGGSDILVDANLCESLLTLTPEGESVPGLASSIDRPDDTTFVVNLRQGVTFSDGNPMTAQDVVFSLDRVRDPEAGSYWGQFASRVTSVKATDDQTVTITLDEPDAVFYRMLATPMAQIVQQDYVEKAADKYGSPSGGVMCTGPYTLDEWQPGTSIVLKANPTWWNAQTQQLRTQSATFTFLTEDSTVTSALLNDDIDGSFSIPRTTLDRLLSAPNGKVYLGPSTAQLVLIPTQLSADSTSTLANPKLREAFAKSIDYAGLISSTLKQAGEPLRAAMPPGGWGTAESTYAGAYDELADPAQDLDAAKALVEESGVSKPKVTLAVPASIPEYVSQAEVIQSNASQAGFDVTLKPLPAADFNALFASPQARSKVDVFLADWYADVPEPLQLYLQFGTPGGVSDFGGYDNPETATLLNQARSTMDDEARAELTVQAQKILTDDLVWIPLAYPLNTLFLNDRLGGATSAFPFVMYSPWLATIGGR